jgi:hypothetical protein
MSDPELEQAIKMGLYDPALDKLIRENFAERDARNKLKVVEHGKVVDSADADLAKAIELSLQDSRDQPIIVPKGGRYVVMKLVTVVEVDSMELATAIAESLR